MENEIKRNCMTHMQGRNLINFIESLADDGKIKMTAQKIAEASEAIVGIVPSKQSVQKFCRELKIEYDFEARTTIKGSMPDRVGELEAENSKMLKAYAALEDRVSRLEFTSKVPPLAPSIPIPARVG